MKIIKIVITLISLGLLIVHLFFYKITFDPVAITFLVFAILPWVISIIKSIELPGGITIELKDVLSMTNKLTNFQFVGSGGIRIKKDSSTRLEFSSASPIKELIDISISNPSLSLAGVRIEIEKRIREIAKKNEINKNIPLGSTIKELQSREILSNTYSKGLLELVNICNKVIHGAKISDDAVKMVLENTPPVLKYLDELNNLL